MRKYIFLTPGIANMGGSEMFTYNKWKYLSLHGWDVNIFYFNKGGKFFLKELEQYKDNCIPDLIYDLSFISKRRQKKIVHRILNGILDDDEVVVESHLYGLTQWGELIAQKTSGKSIMNCMEENIRQISAPEAAFVEYKLKRHEILNTSVKSLHRYFGRFYNDSYEQYIHTYMRVYCSNVVTHSVKSEIVPNKADFYILSVGRLEKPYVLPTLKEVKKFVDFHNDKSFCVSIIGGDPKGDVKKKIKYVFRDCNNVDLLFYGYMFPVPYNLIDRNDVAIASANSVLVSSNEGVPTIVIDIHDNLPIGIYGRTTNNLFSRDNEAAKSVVGLLDDVLIKKQYPKTAPIISDESVEMEEVFGRQVEFLNLSPRDGAAYPVNMMFSRGRIIKDRVKYFLHQIGF